MEWTKADIFTTSEGADYICAMLTAAGINGFEVEDKNDFNEFLKNTTSHWDYVDDGLMRLKDCETKVTFYIPNNPQGLDTLSDIKSRLGQLPETLPDIELGRLDICINNVNEEDWSNEWKKYYQPLEIGKKLIVIPEWEQKVKNGRIPVVLNPGMAFGTGQHNTTRLCMEFLEQNIVPGCSVLDIGCGSGILAVTGVLLGASHAEGIDIDELAVKIAGENSKLNSTDGKTKFFCGTLKSEKQNIDSEYDVICMNIVADVIISMLKDVKKMLKASSHLLLSGIIDTREQDVLSALSKENYKIIKRKESGGWVALDCVR